MSWSLEAVSDAISALLHNGVRVIQFGAGGITSGYGPGSVDAAALATAVKPLGVGQTWQDMSGSRSAGVTYTNSTGRPIEIHVAMAIAVTNNFVRIFVGSTSINSPAVTAGSTGANKAIVPSGATYSAVDTSGGTAVTQWHELR